MKETNADKGRVLLVCGCLLNDTLLVRECECVLPIPKDVDEVRIGDEQKKVLF